MSILNGILAKINKKFGEGAVGFASDGKYVEPDRLSSGSLFLDYILGKNKKGQSGWTMGRIVELYGQESSGKSLISMKTVVEAQKKGYICAYMDAENTFDANYARKLGVDTSKLIISKEQKAEKALDFACQLVQEEQVKVIVFDSITSLVPIKILETNLDDSQQMAAMAQVMSRALPKLIALNKNNTLVIFINQLREKPGVIHGNPEYTPGGRSLKYYASMRVEIRKGEWLFDETDKKKKIGQAVRFKGAKNKTAIPSLDGYFKFNYVTSEIDKVDELVSLALLEENSLIDRRGAYFSILDKSFHGREEMEKELKTNKEFFEEVRKAVFEK